MAQLEVAAEGLNFPEGPVWRPDGSVLVVEMAGQAVSRVNKDGTKDIIVDTPGCPNGIAIGPDGAAYVANNGGTIYFKVDGLNRVKPGVPEGYAGGWVERVDLTKRTREVLYSRCGEFPFTGPNDLVFDRHGGFYFADYGKQMQRMRPNGGIYYGLADGSRVVECAYPLITPNGIGLSPDGSVVYVSESETGRIWTFDVEKPGVFRRNKAATYPHGGICIWSTPRSQRLDSLKLDSAGNICVATIYPGGIAVVSPQGELLEQVETGDPVTTSICFGGHDLKTAYITASSSGRLLKMKWPVAGLPLNFA